MPFYGQLFFHCPRCVAKSNCIFFLSNLGLAIVGRVLSFVLTTAVPTTYVSSTTCILDCGKAQQCSLAFVLTLQNVHWSFAAAKFEFTVRASLLVIKLATFSPLIWCFFCSTACDEHSFILSLKILSNESVRITIVPQYIFYTC